MRKVPEKVPAKAFQERFLQLKKKEGLTLREVALRAGWMDGSRPDGSRVGKTLGIVGGQVREKRKMMTYDAACDLCIALDLYPVDVGV